MKKSLLVLSIISIIFSGSTKAQVLNNSFENWVTDTAYFEGFNFFPKDTFLFSDPVDWTTTNALSGADTFGGLFLVTQSADAHTGSSAMRLTTEAFDTVGTPLGQRKLTIPGLALNGVFPLNLPSGILLGGGTISPILIPGAGQPMNKRLANIKGFFKYSPVFNDSTQATDSCMVWATLKKGNEIVANAIFKSDDTITSYTQFSAPFEYVSCSIPDTLVILIASSVPNIGSLLVGTTKLVSGSVLLIDDMDYDTLAANSAFPPFAHADFDTTNKNTPKNIAVKLNDEDCDNLTLVGETVTVVTAPLKGTAVVTLGVITYTPSTDSIGIDSFTYSLNDGSASSSAVVRVFIRNVTGLDEVKEVPVSVYPVPASNELNVIFEHGDKSTVKVYDIIGNLVLTTVLNKGDNRLNIAQLANGSYGLQIMNEKDAVIARSKFTVSK